MPPLGFQPALFGPESRPGLAAWFGSLAGSSHQLDQAINGLAPVGLLGAFGPGKQCQDAIRTDSPPRELDQAMAHIFRQRRRILDIEPQPDGSRHLVHILTARPRGPYEVELELIFVQDNAVINRN